MNLENTVVLLSFIHKVFLLKADRKIAWITGIIASIVSIYYFYVIGLNIYSGLEVGLVILMGYGLVKNKTTRIEDLINLFTGVLCLILAYLSFVGLLTMFEMISSVSALLGIYFLAHNKDKLGWSIWIATYLMTTWVVYEKGQMVMVVYQLFSLILAVYGLNKSYSKLSAQKQF